MLCWGGFGSPHSFHSRSFVHHQRQVRCGWINLCFLSHCTSPFQSTLKMKLVPKTRQVLQPSKGTMLKITHPCSPPLPLTVSPRLGADKSYCRIPFIRWVTGDWCQVRKWNVNFIKHLLISVYQSRFQPNTANQILSSPGLRAHKESFLLNTIPS